MTGAVVALVGAGSAAVVTEPAAAATYRAATTTTTGSDWTFGSRASIGDIAKTIRADVAYKQGLTGKGVGVALIDTGVVPVTGLTSGNIANGPDLSIESQVPALIHKDGFGHGTHMAGIIAGRDNTNGTGFRGIAPDAKLTSIKVGNTNGAVDVTQVMAAIDWVVEHRNDDRANPIRVINLSYGTSSSLIASSNPLAAAAENAWRAGIVVVVASGNTGRNITVPATDGAPIVVGSADPKGTTDPSDDTVSSFSADAGRIVISGGKTYNVPIDVVVPGRSVVSLRSPGSFADTLFPLAREGTRYFTGSGTSQATAVVSGAIALILQKFPNLKPDEVRQMMWGRIGAKNLYAKTPPELDLQYILGMTLKNVDINTPWSSGSGSLQAARGGSVLTFGPDNVPLTGEKDLFGPFSTSAWMAASKAGTSWKGGAWMGNYWTGDGWGADTDGQQNWNGRAWSGRAWSGRAWSDNGWSGRSWSGRSWSGITTATPSWSGVAWSGAMWY